MEAYEIVHSVYDAFKKLPEKLSQISTKSKEWYLSHGRQPKTENPTASGNASAVTHYIRYCKKFEAVEPGAGMMLSNRVHAELEAQFRHTSLRPQSDLHCDFIDESKDVMRWLASIDLNTASLSDLREVERECNEAAESAMRIRADARARMKLKEIGRRAA